MNKFRIKYNKPLFIPLPGELKQQSPLCWANLPFRRHRSCAQSAGFGAAPPSWTLCSRQASGLLQQPSGMGAERLGAGLFMVPNSSGVVWACFLSFLSHVGSFCSAYSFPCEKEDCPPNPTRLLRLWVMFQIICLDSEFHSGSSKKFWRTSLNLQLHFNSLLAWPLTPGQYGPCSV